MLLLHLLSLLTITSTRAEVQKDVTQSLGGWFQVLGLVNTSESSNTTDLPIFDSSFLEDSTLNSSLNLNMSNSSEPDEKMGSVLYDYFQKFSDYGENPDSLYQKNESGVGYWVVFDEMESNLTKPIHRRPPSCIIARMEVTILLPDDLNMADSDEVWSNRTLYLPTSAVALNETCGTEEQSLNLVWSQNRSGEVIDQFKISLTFNQTTEDSSTINYLSHIFIELTHRTNLNNTPFELLIAAEKDVKLMEAPKLFAFCCKEDIQVEMDGAINKSNLTSSHTESIHLRLRFSNLCIEPFRDSRYYDDLTHLKYNCKYGWPYQFVPEAVLTCLFLYSAVTLAAFVYKYKKRKLEIEGRPSDEQKLLQ